MSGFILLFSNASAIATLEPFGSDEHVKSAISVCAE
jgi:hypothetical protein